MPEIQGHRICGRLSVENSRAAVTKARELGFVKSVEFDVRSTSCGRLVVAHGPEHNEGGIKVEDHIYDELIHKLTLSNGETVPLLTDIIDLCIASNIIMNIEVKEFDENIISQLLDILKTKSASHLARISSFRRLVLQRIRQLDPSIPLGVLYNDTLHIEESTGHPVRQITPKDSIEFHVTHLNPIHALDSINLCAETITPEEVREFKSAGLKVLAWFPSHGKPHLSDDHTENIQKLAALGVDVICTNRPDIAAAALLN